MILYLTTTSQNSETILFTELLSFLFPDNELAVCPFFWGGGGSVISYD